MKKLPKKAKHILYGTGAFAVVLYFLVFLYAIHVALVMEEDWRLSFSEALDKGFKDLLKQPFAISPIPVAVVAGFLIATLLILALGALFYADYRMKKAHNPDTALGSQEWLTALEDYDRKNTDPIGEPNHNGKNNLIIADELFLSFDNQATGRNSNVLVVGGSGIGKTYRYVGPNILQMNCSYVITDPSGELFAKYGNILEANGYRVRCFNVNRMTQGCYYNPLEYIKTDKDIEILVNALIENTSPPDKKGGGDGDFWEKAEKLLLSAMIGYLIEYETDKTRRNLPYMVNLISQANPKSDSKGEDSTLSLDSIFDRARQLNPESFAVKNYDSFKSGAGKTVQSILISVSARLQPFLSSSVINLTQKDTLELKRLGDEKTALFLIVATGDNTFNFLTALLYTQLFLLSYDYAEGEAEYGWYVCDSDGEVVKVFRATDGKRSKEEARNNAAQFLKECRSLKISYNEQKKWYDIRTQKGKLIAWRGMEGLAKKAAEKIKNGYLQEAQKTYSDGKHLPIHLRMICDEFKNIGRIPTFETRLATVRKYNISFDIILQSISQLKEMYEKNWNEITGNCDNFVYLGGGIDKETFKLVSEAIGKETRVIQNYSFGDKGVNTSQSRQGVALIDEAELRTLENDECIAIPRGLFAYKGKRLYIRNHPMYAAAMALNEIRPYQFSGRKIRDLMEELNGTTAGEIIKEKHKGEVVYPEDEKRDLRQEQKYEKKEAEDARKNSSGGEQIVESNVPTTNQTLSLSNDKEIKQATLDLLAMTAEGWRVSDLIFTEAPAGISSSK